MTGLFRDSLKVDVHASTRPRTFAGVDALEDKYAEPAPIEPILRLSRVGKDFGSTRVVHDVSFVVGRGEFVSLLGPSGSGKTTILRMIAGLEPASRGETYLKSERIDDKPPYERHVTTVFQDYALFPHMNVFENVAFGLRCQRLFSEAEITKRVHNALSLVRLNGYEQRTVRNLSGGERQRVAVARAVVTEPTLLLLDEPLGALDLKLRRETGKELRELHRRLGLAFLYVTHDQEEALSMSDRVILVHRGRIEQAGAPAELFWRPRTKFVAEFIGEANVLSGTLVGAEGSRVQLDLGGGVTCLAEDPEGVSTAAKTVDFAIRGERIMLGSEAASCTNHYLANIAEVRFYGSLVELTIVLANSLRLRARFTAGGPQAGLPPGATTEVGWDASSAVVLTE